MPLKREALPLLGRTTRGGRAGACNTLVLDPDGSRHGVNTDVPGALRCWASTTSPWNGPWSSAAAPPRPRCCWPWPSAAAARHAPRPRPDRAAETVGGDGAPSAPTVDVVLIADVETLAGDVLVSTVPAAAQVPGLVAALADIPLVFDVVYDPWPTPLAAAAERSGRTCSAASTCWSHRP